MVSTQRIVFDVTLTFCATFLLNYVSCELEQSFTEQPSATEAILGDAEVILKCKIANIAGDLHWQKDDKESIAVAYPRNTPISSLTTSDRLTVIGNHTAGEYHLRLANVILLDDGEYRCYVTPFGNHTKITSSSAKLTIGKAPGPISIANSPNITVVVDKPVNLSCKATAANPPVTMSWLREGESKSGALDIKIPTPDDETGKLSDTTSVLTLTPTKDDDGKTFECQSTNMALKIPRNATIKLDVQYSPTVSVECLETGDLREGTIVGFKCNAEANPSRVTYVWSKNNEVIPGEEVQLNVSLSRDDNGVSIECKATNSIGFTSSSMSLAVKYGPKIIESPESVSVDEGAPGSMRCTADGNPSATVKWTRLGSRATLSTLETLQFDSVTESDIGTYVCTARVDGFEVHDVSYGTLYINGIPEIVSAPVQKAKLRGKATLECFTGTKPDPHTIIWMWNGGQIETGSKGRVAVIRTVTKGGVLSTLTITKVKPEDFTDYNCTMINDVGSTSFVVTLQQSGLDLIIYVIIGVVSTLMFVFILTILVMIYCKRRYKLRKENKGKIDISIERRSDSEDSIDKPKQSRSNSPSSSGSKPRYADPHDYLPRRGSRDTHDTWDDPFYHGGAYNGDWRDSFADRFPMRRTYSSNDYIEPDDLPHGNLPEWRDNFDTDKDRQDSVADEDKSYRSYEPQRRDSSKYRQPPIYDEFKDRYEEDDKYAMDWPDTEQRYPNDRPYSNDRRYSNDRSYSKDKEPIYSNEYDDYDSRDRYGNHADYDDSNYGKFSNRDSVASDDTNKLATNV